MAGIASYGAYVPQTRLPLSLISGRPAKEGGPEKAVANYDEDAITMGVSAALDCLAGFERQSIDAVFFASTSYPLREKQAATLIAKALDLPRAVATSDHAGSLRAGTAALEAALNAVAAGSARNALVVISDARLGAPRGALEAKLGDGAAAFLVSDSHTIADYETSSAVADELQDMWRIDGETFTHSWEDRFVVQEGYTPNMAAALGAYFEKTGSKPGDYAKAALYAHDARSVAGLAKQSGLAPEQLQNPLFGRLGNTGCAFAPMLLAHALETAKAGERLLVDAKEWESGADLGLSATIRFRERDADISMKGAKCTSCGQIHFPAQRVCYKCYAKDEWEPVRLSDKPGKLLAYTFDYFFPSSEPPTIMIMTEVEGCRVQVQLCNTQPDEVRLDMPVEYVFRVIHKAGGKPNYFWKASPTP
jgi:3-hydroxy-3-methylglutaryl CoA synthase/uncharacterized OB-fold protein